MHTSQPSPWTTVCWGILCGTAPGLYPQLWQPVGCLGGSLPHWHLLASAVLHHALRTATCPPYCKPSSANTVLKPDQELVNWEMEQSVGVKQQAREVEKSAALIFLTIFVVTLGLLIGFTPLQLHLGWCLNCCSVLYKEQKYCIFKSSTILS